MPTESTQRIELNIDWSAPTKFVGGWYEGITGEDKMREINMCWNGAK